MQPTARITGVARNAVAANFVATMRQRGGAAAAVVKADAYGLGMAGVVPSLLAAGCDSYFVARLEEGMALRALAPDAYAFSCSMAPCSGREAALIRAPALIPVLGSLERDRGRWQGTRMASLEAWPCMCRYRHEPAGLAAGRCGRRRRSGWTAPNCRW